MRSKSIDQCKVALSLILVTLLAAMSVSLGIQPVQAANHDDELERNGAAEVSQEVIEKADPYVSLKDGKFIIEPTIKDHLSNDELQKVEESVAEANKQVNSAREKRHLEKSGPEFTETTTEEAVVFTESSPKLENTDGDEVKPYFQEGRTSISYFWWGVRIHLSKTTVQTIGAGVGIAGVWVPEPVVSKILATLGIAATMIPGGVWADYSYAALARFSIAPWSVFPMRVGFQ